VDEGNDIESDGGGEDGGEVDFGVGDDRGIITIVN
jgi:hypothetical protein